MLILAMQAGHRPMVVIKDKNNSLLIIKLQNAVRGDEVSSFDSKEISNFSAEAEDLFTTFCVTFDAVLPPFLVTFPLKNFLLLPLEDLYLLEEPIYK